MMKVTKLLATRPIEVKTIASNKSGDWNIHNIDKVDYYRETNIKDQGTYIENQYNAAEQKTLAEAANEIQQLLEQLSQTYPTDTITGQMTVATEVIKEVENNLPLADRILSALRAGGTNALKQTLNHPAATFVLSALEDWQKSKEQK
ncbi:hypothetical protein [Okeania sp. SIO2B9]|uniref:hypothetical protein n=1 Tax=Okeania sp. SIO2B9 TaxID=2607782 RepID=UPI00257B2CA8|nr:hypothetical protein [Okeania sp. SIO2B9]